MLRLLDHPNIIKYEGVYETDNLIYLVTEYLEGGTLEEAMRHKSKLTGEYISGILTDTLTALCYLQGKKIMHRDLKPANILQRGSDKKWVLVDFGLASNLLEKALYDKCGTSGYIAPEIMAHEAENIHNKVISSACDLYSLGIVAYELIVGCLPFRVET